ncbi:hypothetical protein DO72_5593 [Burkholderia pseudomallei]|nr:hypothetical protein DO72_5593 [Burkholderia pseudomallei]
MTPWKAADGYRPAYSRFTFGPIVRLSYRCNSPILQSRSSCFRLPSNRSTSSGPL